MEHSEVAGPVSSGDCELDTIEKVCCRAKSRGVGCRKRAREHTLSSKRWAWIRMVLETLTVIGSTVAGSSLLLASDQSGWKSATVGIAALLAALLTGVNTALQTGKTSEAHRQAAARFTVLRGKYFTLHDLPPEPVAMARAELDRIQEAHDSAESTSPAVESWTRKRRAKQEREEEVAAIEEAQAELTDQERRGELKLALKRLQATQERAERELEDEQQASAGASTETVDPATPTP